MPKRLLSVFILTVIAPSLGLASNVEESRDILDRAMKDKNPDTRKQAAIALSLAGPNEPYPQRLEAMLDDKDYQVRLASIASLVDVNNSLTIPALKKALNDDVPEVSFAAARALYALGDLAGKQALLSVLSGEMKATSGFFAKQKRETLRLMHTPKSMFMFALRQGAAFAPVPGLGAGVASLEGLLNDPSVSGRATAALLLEKENDAPTIQALREALTDKDWSVRAAGVHALTLRNDPAFQPDETKLLQDKSEPVRLRAAAGYLRLETIKNQPKPKPAPVRKRRTTKT